MGDHRKQTLTERREHLQALVLLGSLIVQRPKRGDVRRQFVVFSEGGAEG